ncbi:unnamed protein product [Gordionus sp. m RMFG-2023]|uniref:transcription initiation factor TFIID subunit 5-like isoform X1 n=1 Tax=Gordionus sp. m RMFG-2023 TaxID=3053472 RepID=UPI0030E1C8F3
MNFLPQETKNKIIELLRDNNLNETVHTFLKEIDNSSKPIDKFSKEYRFNQLEIYSKLVSLVEMSLDKYKAEFANLLYPIFIHTFIELIYENQTEESQRFFTTFSQFHTELHQEDMKQLVALKTKVHADNNDLLNWFRFNKYSLRFSRETLAYLKYHLTKNNLHDIINKMDTFLDIEIADEPPRSAKQIKRVIGALEGESRRHVNKTKIYCGLLKESDVVVSLGPPGQNNEEEDSSAVNALNSGDFKKKKTKKESFLLKKSKTDPLGPPFNRIPLPELKESDKMLKILMAQESLKRFKITPTTLPSVCCYTILNAKYSVTSAVISEDSSILAIGYGDGNIKVYSLTPQKLKTMKQPSELGKLDASDDDVLHKIMDEKNVSDIKLLTGHTEAITALSISHDKLYILSSSQDGTIKLWSLLVYKDIICYKGHMLPVWDVKFGPYGHYFASCGADKSIRLWAMDQHQPLRIFVGHHSDIDVLAFHPNSNYLASGSTDRTVRMWDILTGHCVRMFSGHKTPITALVYSTNGRHLISASSDGQILVWDLIQGHLIIQLNHHTAPVYTLNFDKDGVCLTSGGSDCDLAFWDYKGLSECEESSSLYAPSGDENLSNTVSGENTNKPEITTDKYSDNLTTHKKGQYSTNPNTLSRDSGNRENNGDRYLMKYFRTKNSAILHIHYTWRNLVLIVAEYCAIK